MENSDLKICKVVSIINMKGGVGKTTLSCNIAIELAERGNRVLVIDSDPQFNTTQTLFKYFHDNVNKYNKLNDENLTLRSIFTNNNPVGMSKNNCDGSRNVIYKFLKSEDKKSLDLIPGDLRLIIDINTQASDRFKAFFNKQKLREEYDYIIIDCPPTWGELTSISLELSDYYLIPTKLDEFSTIGITLLSTLIEEKVAANPGTLNCLGVVYMMLNETGAKNGIARNHRPFKGTIEKFYKEMSESVGSKVKEFDTVIYNKQPIATETVVYKKHADKYPELSDRICELVDEILDRISNKEAYYA
ncbi:hypothetical protein FDF31_03830 [Clostridium sporogenes]|nr:hypothetical protein [Clostridium sporogenes]NFS24803.1 hypothetical protein [Clostridium sporogenes]